MSLQETITLAGKTLVVLDCETTGFYPESGDEIIELAGEKIIAGLVVDSFQALLIPTRPVPLEASAIHGLTNTYLSQHGQEARDVFPLFQNFIKDAVLVGHNIIRFDWPFILSHFTALGLPSSNNKFIDTLPLARQTISLPNYKLGTIAQHFGISTLGAHRAMADVVMTRQILHELLPLVSERLATSK